MEFMRPTAFGQLHEYIVDLREFHRQKNNTAKPNISVGYVILIQDKGKKIGLWKMGLVENLFPDKDGKVRGAVVAVLASQGIVRTKLRNVKF